MKHFLAVFSLLAIVSCASNEEKEKPTQTRAEVIQEIYDMERAFNDMLAKEGRAAAFAHFAAPDGGIQRNGRMVMGKDSIYAFYAKSTTTNVTLTWKPDFVDVSDDFTMAYTWGKAQYSGTRENGEDYQGEGMFHTVWKKQADGTWRYVYD